jgi:GNAT superfamily N-acetyltransferase
LTFDGSWGFFELSGPPDSNLAAALAAFESSFTYPFGDGLRFRIDHGDDYPGFFRAMGESRTFVVTRNGLVAGAVGVAIRTFHSAAGAPSPAAYIGDFKILPGHRGRRIGWELLRAVQGWCAERCEIGYGVVMGGTQILPAAYTGRTGFPLFQPIGRLSIVAMPVDQMSPATGGFVVEEKGNPLSSSRSYFSGGKPTARSLMQPVYIRHPLNKARGFLEDTRKVKRLFVGSNEWVSTHLSDFSYEDEDAAFELVLAARALSRGLKAENMYVTLDAAADAALLRRLKPHGVSAPAIVYGTGFSGNQQWMLNSSEV